MNKRKVLVSGATGQQGGSVVQALLKEGHAVIGLTRNMESAKAKRLLDQGVELIEANFTDLDSLINIFRGVDAVYAMTTPFEAGPDHEIEQGKTIADAAKGANVQHFIFSSVADANNVTGIPHFDSKYEVEKYIVSLGLPYTIVAPVYFMDNLLFPFNLDTIKEGKLSMAMPGNINLQQISVEDIGKFVGYVVNHPEDMLGKRVNIAGDEISGDEVAIILSKYVGREIKYEGFDPKFLEEQSVDLAAMYRWFIDHGYTADLEALRTYNLSTFEGWVAKQDWESLLGSASLR